MLNLTKIFLATTPQNLDLPQPIRQHLYLNKTSNAFIRIRGQRRDRQKLNFGFQTSAQAYSVVKPIREQDLYLQLFDWSNSWWREITFYVYT